MNVAHSNTDWCNIAGKASDMHVEVSLLHEMERKLTMLLGASRESFLCEYGAMEGLLRKSPFWAAASAAPENELGSQKQ